MVMHLNYHELTREEPKDSPQRRKQNQLMVIVFLTVLSYVLATTGILMPINVVETDTSYFPGGEMLYKTTESYFIAAASERLCTLETFNLPNTYGFDTADMFHNIYLDNFDTVGDESKTRIVSSLLFNDHNKDSYDLKQKKSLVTLLAKNEEFKNKRGDAQSCINDKFKYKQAKLPKVKAGILHFPTNSGLSSDMAFRHKIYPALYNWAKDVKKMKEEDIVIISTCSIPTSMCTYYVPLEKQSDFFLGKPITKEYAKIVAKEKELKEKAKKGKKKNEDVKEDL